jgi:cell wall hydrolase
MTAAPTPWDIEVVARTVYGEARGEPPEGRLAVAYSIVNRLASGRWYAGRRLAETVLIRDQYSCWNSDKGDDADRRALVAVADDDPVLEACREAVHDALSGEVPDPTGGATHYESEKIEPSPWVPSATFCGKFGSQLFYKGVA